MFNYIEQAGLQGHVPAELPIWSDKGHRGCSEMHFGVRSWHRAQRRTFLRSRVGSFSALITSAAAEGTTDTLAMRFCTVSLHVTRRPFHSFAVSLAMSSPADARMQAPLKRMQPPLELGTILRWSACTSRAGPQQSSATSLAVSSPARTSLHAPAGAGCAAGHRAGKTSISVCPDTLLTYTARCYTQTCGRKQLAPVPHVRPALLSWPLPSYCLSPATLSQAHGALLCRPRPHKGPL